MSARESVRERGWKKNGSLKVTYTVYNGIIIVDANQNSHN